MATFGPQAPSGLPYSCRPWQGLPRITSDAPLSTARPVAEADQGPKSQVLIGVNVYSQDPAYVIAVAGRHLLHVLKERTTATAVSLLRRALTDLANAFPTFGYLGIVEPEAQLSLPPDILDGVQANVRRFTSRFTGAAVVFEKPGFQATAVRSVVTSINVAARATHPTNIFADLREAVSWLSQLTPGEPTAARLLTIAKQL